MIVGKVAALNTVLADPQKYFRWFTGTVCFMLLDRLRRAPAGMGFDASNRNGSGSGRGDGGVYIRMRAGIATRIAYQIWDSARFLLNWFFQMKWSQSCSATYRLSFTLAPAPRLSLRGMG